MATGPSEVKHAQGLKLAKSSGSKALLPLSSSPDWPTRALAVPTAGPAAQAPRTSWVSKLPTRAGWSAAPPLVEHNGNKMFASPRGAEKVFRRKTVSKKYYYHYDRNSRGHQPRLTPQRLRLEQPARATTGYTAATPPPRSGLPHRRPSPPGKCRFFF